MTTSSTLRIGIDLAKGVFQVHAVRQEPGEPVAFTRRLKRSQMEPLFAKLPPSLIGIEACGSAHYWARVAQRYGHEVRLMPPAYVKAYLKRNKSDALDAEAICEAVGRPTMRFVPVKDEVGQAILTLHRMRASFVERRTAVTNQLRAALSEFGIVAPVGVRGFNDLLELVETRGEGIAQLPPALLLVLEELARQWRGVDAAVQNLERVILADLKERPRAKKLTKVPSIGPMGASAIEAALPNPHVFRSGRDFAAWMGLTPGVDKSANTVRKMPITKKGDGYLRRLLVLGATMRLALIRRGRAKDVSAWERRMAAHPKRKLAAVALANKSARIAWAMLAKNEIYRVPVVASAAAA